MYGQRQQGRRLPKIDSQYLSLDIYNDQVEDILKLQCAVDSNDYIHDLPNFGLLYSIDDEKDRFSNGTETCETIEEAGSDHEVKESSERTEFYKKYSLQEQVQHLKTDLNFDKECN